MAMTMNGDYEQAVPPQTVWEKLNDAATLKACIPGCEQLDKTSDTEFQAVATVKMDRWKPSFKARELGPIPTRRMGTKFPGRAMAVSPASPRAAPPSNSRPRTAARCCTMTSMRR